MREIQAENAAEYLYEQGQAVRGELLEVREMSGGVSNIVLLVTRTNGESFVVKQARAQLRVPQPWFCSVQRVLREIDVLHVCDRVLRRADSPPSIGWSAVVPQILFEDRDNFLFGMTAAPAPHATWKQELLAGHFSPEIAAACGRLLGKLHAGTWHDSQLAEQLGDRAFFDDLRLDPYYREVARVHPDLKPALDRLIDSVWSNQHCLVHGDFSPKNLLVWQAGLMLLDFEVGHYGDPAFDLGFFLAHLILKTIHHRPQRETMLMLIDRFWHAYWCELETVVDSTTCIELEWRAHQNLGGCLLARVDGKSRVEYSHNPPLVRELGRWLLELAVRPARTLWSELRAGKLKELL